MFFIIFLTLSELQHKIKTRYGTSKKGYSAKQGNASHQGIGQGNGIGPMEWEIISSPLFDTMRKAGYGAEFLTSLTNQSINLGGYGFIDDVDLVQTHTNERKLIPKANK